MKKKKKSSKGIIFLCLFICVCTFSILYSPVRNYIINSVKSYFPVSETSEPKQPVRKELRQLLGTLANKSDGIITVLSDEGKKYTIKVTDDKLIESSKKGIIAGCPVTVYYYGMLNENLDVQNVQIEKINIDNSNYETLRARQILDTMSLDEKVGQMFIVRCPQNNAAKLASEYHPGGYILFADDFKGKTKSSMLSQIQSYQSASKLSMLIGVDEEGGTVNRVSLYTQFRAVPFWSPQRLYAKGGWDLIASDTKEKAELLRSIGINVNFAPVCDVSTNRRDFIYARSFGKDAALTSQYVEKVVTTMHENGLGSILKHFPGYGNNVDTHTGIAIDNRSYDSFVKSDFLPFTSGINAGADSVLVSHNIVKSMDAKNPASLSANVHQILRKQLNFNGVIMTDDLSMNAIREFTGEDNAAVMAVQAGNDMICCTDFQEQIPAVVNAVKSSRIPIGSIDDSVVRILRWKLNLGIIK